MLKLCLAAALGVCAMSAAPDSRLADAAMAPDKTAVRSLLAQKADVNAPQPDGTTALHWAARWDDMQLAAVLIKAGADPRKANRIGATPMFLAAQNGSAMMLEMFLKLGVGPDAPILSHGETAL